MSNESNSILSIDDTESVFEQARTLQQQAASAGFDWPDLQSVLSKVDEELAELKEAISSGDEQHTQEELADLLFVLVNLGRHLDVSLEAVLPQAIQKFIKRFHQIEHSARAQGKALHTLSLEQMEVAWLKAKQLS